MNCSNCGRATIEGAAFCGHCGAGLRAPAEEAPAPQPLPRICTCCGSTMGEQSRFCARCGAPFGAVPPAPVPPPPAMPNASVPPFYPPADQGKKKKGKGRFIAALVVLLLAAGITAGYFAVSGGWDIRSALPALLQWSKTESPPEEDSSASDSPSSSSMSEPPVSQSSSQPPAQQNAPNPVAGYWRLEISDQELVFNGTFWHFSEDGTLEIYCAKEMAAFFEEEEGPGRRYLYDREKELLYIFADEADMEDSGEKIIWDGNDLFILFDQEFELIHTWVRVSKDDVPPDAVRIALG